VGKERLQIERLATTDGAGEIFVVVARMEADGRGGGRGNHDGSCAGGNLPQGGGALFLEFGMRREILVGKHVPRGKGDDGVRIAGGGEFAKSSKDRREVFDGAVVVDYENERPSGSALKQHEQQGFCRGGEAGDTNTPRALLEVGGNTREGGKLFYVREEFADEGKKHAF
jgi:hypothetical protein